MTVKGAQKADLQTQITVLQSQNSRVNQKRGECSCSNVFYLIILSPDGAHLSAAPAVPARSQHSRLSPPHIQTHAFTQRSSLTWPCRSVFSSIRAQVRVWTASGGWKQKVSTTSLTDKTATAVSPGNISGNLASTCSTMFTSYVAANRSHLQFGVEQVEYSVFFCEHRWLMRLQITVKDEQKHQDVNSTPLAALRRPLGSRDGSFLWNLWRRSVLMSNRRPYTARNKSLNRVI